MNMMLATLWGSGSTVKWHDGENATPGRSEGQENESG
jgi:hypothetical protein